MTTIWLPGRMPGLNELLDGKAQHGKWNQYNATKSKFGAAIGLVARTNGLLAQGASYVSALWLEPNRKRDPDNIVSGGFKLLNDAFVSAGILSGDGWSEILGLVGYWHHKPERVGVLVHFSPSGLASKETMLTLLGELVEQSGNTRQKDRLRPRNSRDAGRNPDPTEAPVGKP